MQMCSKLGGKSTSGACTVQSQVHKKSKQRGEHWETERNMCPEDLFSTIATSSVPLKSAPLDISELGSLLHHPLFFYQRDSIRVESKANGSPSFAGFLQPFPENNTPAERCWRFLKQVVCTMPNSRYTLMNFLVERGKQLSNKLPRTCDGCPGIFWKSLWSSCLLQLSAQQQLLNKARNCSAILVLCDATDHPCLGGAVATSPNGSLHGRWHPPKQTRNICKDIKLQKVTHQFLATCFQGWKLMLNLYAISLKQGPLTRRMTEKTVEVPWFWVQQP